MDLEYQIWSVIRSILHGNKFSFGTIKAVVGHAGLDMVKMAHLEQTQGPRSGASKSQLLSAIDLQVGEMNQQRFHQFLLIITEEMVRYDPSAETDMSESLQRLGWTFHDGHLLEIRLFDPSDLQELSGDAHVDLVKAATRLRDGDLSGSVTAACAAVDAVTSEIYRSNGLGDHGKASFQERVCQSLKALNTIGSVQQQLEVLGWNENDAKMFADNLRGSLNQAAYVMQSLRSKMGDVHGTKPILKPLVFDSIRWAELIVRLLS
jgi:hypothetical protein